MQTDLWALGITLFESHLGRRVNDGSDTDILRSILTMKIVDLHEGEAIDPDLHRALKALLSAAPERLKRAKAAAHVFRQLEERFPLEAEWLIDAVNQVARAASPMAKALDAPVTGSQHSAHMPIQAMNEKEPQKKPGLFQKLFGKG